jgi:putative metallohydrolase (TIGR04338 family)
MIVRDTQRTRVYDAEVVLDTHARNSYKTAAAVKGRIETILRSSWVLSRFIVHPYAVQLRTPKSIARASYHGEATFSLPPWGWRIAILLHELAHMLESRRREDFMVVRPYSWSLRIDNTPHAAHGWRFCQTYLELVERFMGRAAASDLRHSFAIHRVRCSPATGSPGQPFTPGRRHEGGTHAVRELSRAGPDVRKIVRDRVPGVLRLLRRKGPHDLCRE